MADTVNVTSAFVEVMRSVRSTRSIRTTSVMVEVLRSAALVAVIKPRRRQGCVA